MRTSLGLGRSWRILWICPGVVLEFVAEQLEIEDLPR
jgi:hypothetical protein